MAVFRVEKNSGYTVMSNHHLRNQELSLKAKGLLSQMLSLPDNWDYTLKGLSLINREKIDAIREAIRELERAGYIVRSRERDEKGRLRGADYIIYEFSIMPVFSFFSHRPEFSVVPCVKVQSADHEEHDTKRHPAPNKIFFCKQTRQQPGCRRINQRKQSADHPETDTGTLQP